MKKGIILLLVITLLFTVLSVSGSEESIVICSSAEQFRNDALQEQLNARFPDKNIIVMYMATGKAAAKIYAEGSNSEVDILVAMETGYLNKIKHNLADISGMSRIPYQNGVTVADNGNHWVTWERQAGAIIVNTEILKKHGLEAPKTLQDLLKPEYKGLIAMPDPKSSGTGYFFYKSWVNSMGEAAALEFVDKLHGNLKQFTESGSGPIKMLKQGEIAIGLALTFQAINEINDGQPFEIIFPETGSPYSLTGTAIIDGHRDKEGVEEVYDFIVNEFLIYDKENFSPEQIYDGQVNKISGYPEDIAYADMTGIQDDKEKERLLALWKY
ncbi:MAG: extracellular solute-binding protein [Oscillospiraceae bacterium]|nr:extracellular solute-binding protein [Oscillospiraceae bacterium]